MKKFLMFLCAVMLVFGVVSSANAVPVTFFGEDLAGVGGRTNSDIAHNNFMSNLTGVGTEDFEGFTDGTSSPLTLDFGSAGTALLSGSGAIQAGYSVGRWATSGSKYWETNTNFTISFSQHISAFGFYGTDIGDFSGQLLLTYENGTSTTLNVGNTVGAPNASALYFGFYENDINMAFTSITFQNTLSSDWFGFDDMTIGTYGQVVPNNPVPEPSTILLMGLGLLGLMGFSRKKLIKKG